MCSLEAKAHDTGWDASLSFCFNCPSLDNLLFGIAQSTWQKCHQNHNCVINNNYQNTRIFCNAHFILYNICLQEVYLKKNIVNIENIFGVQQTRMFQVDRCLLNLGTQAMSVDFFENIFASARA